MRSTGVWLRRRALPPPSTAESPVHSTRHGRRSASSTHAGEAGHRGAAVEDQPAASRRLSRGPLASVITLSSSQDGEEFLSARIALRRGAGRQRVTDVLDGPVSRPGPVRINERTAEAPWTFRDRLRERSRRGSGASHRGDLFACACRASCHVIRPFEALPLMEGPCCVNTRAGGDIPSAGRIPETSRLDSRLDRTRVRFASSTRRPGTGSGIPRRGFGLSP